MPGTQHVLGILGSSLSRFLLMRWEYYLSCCAAAFEKRRRQGGPCQEQFGAQGGERWQQNATHVALFNAFAKKQSNFFHRMTRSVLAWQDESLANGMD